MTYASTIKCAHVCHTKPSIKLYKLLTMSSAFEMSYIKPVNATALTLKWTGHPLFSTKVQYQSFFNETGALMTQYTSLFPINVTSFEMNVDDSVPGYLHNFSLQFVDPYIADSIVTTYTISFTFGKSVYMTK